MHYLQAEGDLCGTRHGLGKRRIVGHNARFGSQIMDLLLSGQTFTLDHPAIIIIIIIIIIN